MSPVNQPRQLYQRSARELDFKSKLNGPIDGLEPGPQALLFAEISLASYLEPGQLLLAAGQMGFSDGKAIEGYEPGCYWLQNQDDSVIVVRGQEDFDWASFRQDKLSLVDSEALSGEVQKAFLQRSDLLWPALESNLQRNRRRLWFCGHGVGGAVASIVAMQCLFSGLPMEPEKLFTFGSPRVGSVELGIELTLDHQRWTMPQDPVPHWPPARFGYRHFGTWHSVDALGRWQSESGSLPLREQVSDFAREISLAQRSIVDMTEHSIELYVDRIFEALRSRT